MAEKKATAKGAAKSKKALASASESVKAEPAAETKVASAGGRKTKPRTRTPQKTTNRYSRAIPYSTFVPHDGEEAKSRRWFVVDATDLVLGRAASRIAFVLRGKHKPTYTPHADVGDFVVVINCEKVKLTGNKEAVKPYYHHSMHPGGLKTRIAKDVRVREPERLLEDAIRRMIPRSPLGRDMMSKLHVYKGPTHPHQAQKPEPLALV